MPPPHLDTAILAHLTARGPGKSICPSEVARAQAPANWRAHMPAVRDAARQLARDGRLRVTQGQRDLDPAEAWTGPIRLRLPRTPRCDSPRRS